MTPAAILQRGLDDGIYSDARLCVLRGNTVLLEEGAGAALFDVASITKVVTAVLALKQLTPDLRVGWLPDAPTIGDLLAHRSGLPAWRPLFGIAATLLRCTISELMNDPELQARARLIYRDAIASAAVNAPLPTYSDLGLCAVGFELVATTSRSLGALAAEQIFEPVGMKSTVWGGSGHGAATTGHSRPREWLPDVESALIPGRSGSDDTGVDDDNAAAIGGEAGHSGLFSTAHDLALLGEEIRQSADEHGTLLPRGPARRMFLDIGGGRTLGLDTPTGTTPALGSLLGRGTLGAAGHLGFTGCSLWMDRDARATICFLTNAVRFERPAVRLRTLRRDLHDACARTLALA